MRESREPAGRRPQGSADYYVFLMPLVHKLLVVLLIVVVVVGVVVEEQELEWEE